MDRNGIANTVISCIMGVALRKESVDRNIKKDRQIIKFRESLSARRAWIEIERPTKGTQGQYVALRKESVDRNA